jgi:ankyrin repeat protein
MTQQTLNNPSVANQKKILLVGGVLTLAAAVTLWNRPHQIQTIPAVFHFITSKDADGLRTALAHSPSAVREIDIDGNTALHEATATGNPDLVELLLNSGADPNALNARGETPLLSALTAPRNNLKLIQLLLKAGADPQHQFPHGDTLLHIAARVPSINSSAVALLIKNPDQLKSADEGGKTPIQLARDFNNTSFLAALH